MMLLPDHHTIRLLWPLGAVVLFFLLTRTAADSPERFAALWATTVLSGAAGYWIGVSF